MNTTGSVGLSSTLRIQHNRHKMAPLSWRLKNFLKYRLPDLPRVIVARVANMMGVATMTSKLYLLHKDANGRYTNYGLVSTRVVTTAGVGFIVDAFQGIVEPEVMKYHAVGTSNTAENITDTGLVAECTTVLNPDSIRATGTLAEGATANIFRTAGTVLFDGTAAIVEHGVTSQAATGGGVLLDRSVFAVVNVVTGESIQFTYELTFTPGS